MLSEADISHKEMFNFGYQAAMRAMHKREDVPPPFIDDLSFSEMLAKLESSKVSFAIENC